MSSRPLRIDADTVESGPLVLDKGPVTHTVDGTVLQATPDLLQWCRRHFAERDQAEFDWERGGRRKLYVRDSDEYFRFYKAAHHELLRCTGCGLSRCAADSSSCSIGARTSPS
jgi:hypothetical protein